MITSWKSCIKDLEESAYARLFFGRCCTGKWWPEYCKGGAFVYNIALAEKGFKGNSSLELATQHAEQKLKRLLGKDKPVKNRITARALIRVHSIALA